MNFRVYPVFILLLIASFANAQNLTGIWRGYFLSGYGINQQRCNYELQVDQFKAKNLKNNLHSLKGVTYSYIEVPFYAKSRLVGIFNAFTKEITINEDSLIQDLAGNFDCMMTCYLEYQKKGNTETLEGTFTSSSSKPNSICGSGYVHLERVQESVFHKESFLENKKPATASASPKSTPPTSKNSAPQPVATAPPVIRPMPSGKNFDTTEATAQLPQTISPPALQQVTKTLPPAPRVLRERENSLVQTINTNSPQIKIELYDNGVVDGDTITVYHNNELIVDSKELTEKPITVNITADSINSHHEFVMVANNLGKIPPNTALMVVTTGGKRYEVNISSDEKRNAKLVIDYTP